LSKQYIISPAPPTRISIKVTAKFKKEASKKFVSEIGTVLAENPMFIFFEQYMKNIQRCWTEPMTRLKQALRYLIWLLSTGMSTQHVAF